MLSRVVWRRICRGCARPTCVLAQDPQTNHKRDYEGRFRDSGQANGGEEHLSRVHDRRVVAEHQFSRTFIIDRSQRWYFSLRRDSRFSHDALTACYSTRTLRRKSSRRVFAQRFNGESFRRINHLFYSLHGVFSPHNIGICHDKKTIHFFTIFFNCRKRNKREMTCLFSSLCLLIIWIIRITGDFD